MPEAVLQLCMSKGWGGLEMYPSKIAPALRARGWQVYCVTLAGSHLGKEMLRQGIEVLEYSSSSRALWRSWHLLRWLRARRITVIHCHKSSDLRVAAFLKARMPSLRIVFTEHMGVSKSKRDLYHRWAYGKVDQVLAISQATYQRNVKALPIKSERISCLYHGLDLMRYPDLMSSAGRRDQRERLGLTEGDMAVGLAARLTPGKGQRVFIEALAKLSPNSRIRGVIIGSTEASQGSNAVFVDELRARIKELGLKDRVIMTGYQSDMPATLAALDMACVPSPNEAFGLSAIEAMAVALPVIASNSGALPEIVTTDTGLLVEPKDIDGWSQAMSWLEENPEERFRLGENGRRRVEGRFELGGHVDVLERCYRSEVVS